MIRKPAYVDGFTDGTVRLFMTLGKYSPKHPIAAMNGLAASHRPSDGSRRVGRSDHTDKWEVEPEPGASNRPARRGGLRVASNGKTSGLQAVRRCLGSKLIYRSNRKWTAFRYP